jgi:hypothetical protein
MINASQDSSKAVRNLTIQVEGVAPVNRSLASSANRIAVLVVLGWLRPLDRFLDRLRLGLLDRLRFGHLEVAAIK